jgi:hypothetical protein
LRRPVLALGLGASAASCSRRRRCCWLAIARSRRGEPRDQVRLYHALAWRAAAGADYWHVATSSCCSGRTPACRVLRAALRREYRRPAFVDGPNRQRRLHRPSTSLDAHATAVGRDCAAARTRNPLSCGAEPIGTSGGAP